MKYPWIDVNLRLSTNFLHKKSFVTLAVMDRTKKPSRVAFPLKLPPIFFCGLFFFTLILHTPLSPPLLLPPHPPIRTLPWDLREFGLQYWDLTDIYRGQHNSPSPHTSVPRRELTFVILATVSSKGFSSDPHVACTQRHILRDRRPSTTACQNCWAMEKHQVKKCVVWNYTGLT